MPFKPATAGIEEKSEELYHVILNINQEEDIGWMVGVVYYLEEMEQTFKYIKDWDEYVSKKNKKKEHEKKDKESKEKDKEKDSNDGQKKPN